MEQINTGMFYTLGKQLQDVFIHARFQIKFWNIGAQTLKQALDALVQGSSSGPYRADESNTSARVLSEELGRVLEVHKADGEAKLSDDQVSRLNSAVFGFDQAVALELGRAPIFYVTAKGVYDTRRLIQDAKAIYHGYEDRLPKDAIDDTNEAGRCLAYDLPTAAGFHLARATEAVIKAYMASHGCAPIRESQRNWGNYIKALEEKGANEKILHHLGQIKDLHRNPVTHPEVSLTMPEAVALWSVCTSVIQSMVGDMEARSASPSPAIAALAPPST